MTAKDFYKQYFGHWGESPVHYNPSMIVKFAQSYADYCERERKRQELKNGKAETANQSQLESTFEEILTEKFAISELRDFWRKRAGIKPKAE